VARLNLDHLAENPLVDTMRHFDILKLLDALFGKLEAEAIGRRLSDNPSEHRKKPEETTLKGLRRCSAHKFLNVTRVTIGRRFIGDFMAAKKNETPTSSKDEQIGYHKGSLSVLAKEREEMMRILQIVEQLMQMHINGLKELGVDLEKEAEKLMGESAEMAKEAPKKGPTKPKNKPPIEDVI
jgi:hypothetical protein